MIFSDFLSLFNLDSVHVAGLFAHFWERSSGLSTWSLRDLLCVCLHLGFWWCYISRSGMVITISMKWCYNFYICCKHNVLFQASVFFALLCLSHLTYILTVYRRFKPHFIFLCSCVITELSSVSGGLKRWEALSYRHTALCLITT